MNKEKVYVFGHRHPDTDSIASAIGYAFFKRAMGVKAIPCRLGEINAETRFLLNRFHFEVPRLMEDARKKIKDIEMDSPLCISKNTTTKEAIEIMRSQERFALGIVDDNHKLIGYVSKTDMAEIGLGDTAAEISLLKQTSVEEMAQAIDGSIVFKADKPHLNGKVSVVVHSQKGTKDYEIKDRIVIIGQDTNAQKELIENGAGVLVVVWSQGIETDVLELAQQYECSIIISGHGTMNTSRFIFLSPPVRLFMTCNPVVLQENMFIEDAKKIMQKTRFKTYPVVNKERNLVGYLSRFHILGYQNKKVIMVDHNEFAQSVHSIEKAQILEVIDHHRINDFATLQPVSFRNEIIGSTSTIIATIFRENQIPIPMNLAGLLLGAILSDTLLFQSPTTTQKDRDTANILAAIANVDIDDFSQEMFSAIVQSENKNMHEMIVQDIKYYDVNGNHCMISQSIVPNTQDLLRHEKEIQEAMEQIVEKKTLDLLVVAFTCIFEEGTMFFLCGDMAEQCEKEFLQNGRPVVKKGILSRKTQILPKLAEILTY